MEYRGLGRTDMTVSLISFGAWAIGEPGEPSTTPIHCAPFMPPSIPA